MILPVKQHLLNVLIAYFSKKKSFTSEAGEKICFTTSNKNSTECEMWWRTVITKSVAKIKNNISDLITKDAAVADSVLFSHVIKQPYLTKASHIASF